MGARTGAPMIRINPREQVADQPGSVGLATAALEGLLEIRRALPKP